MEKSEWPTRLNINWSFWIVAIVLAFLVAAYLGLDIGSLATRVGQGIGDILEAILNFFRGLATGVGS